MVQAPISCLLGCFDPITEGVMVFRIVGFAGPFQPVSFVHDRLWRSLGLAFGLLQLWWRRVDERRAILLLSDRELQDFGANRMWALTEGNKPFWRA
jgi:uncharacterized protein YjiS (DUF1127 family)